MPLLISTPSRSNFSCSAEIQFTNCKRIKKYSFHFEQFCDRLTSHPFPLNITEYLRLAGTPDPTPCSKRGSPVISSSLLSEQQEMSFLAPFPTLRCGQLQYGTHAQRAHKLGGGARVFSSW